MMCGIAGIVGLTGGGEEERVMASMLDVMAHRGPDGRGIHSEEGVFLGHVRLSIIDVEGSRQPLANEDETVWVTFNGEIYNYKEIRAQLIGKGHRFRTQGDTEVLVHLYEEQGQDMLSHLHGMFAFAIWDRRERRLLAARDRMGVKPFYFWHKGQMLIFASEPKAILQHPCVPVSPDPQGLWHYLTYRSVPAPGTLFEGIEKLRPGTLLIWDRRGLTTKAYWDIPLVAERDKPPCTGDCESLVEQAEALLLKSVEQRLISDVPLGAFLSGGLDSSLIVAMMSRLSRGPVRTYSVGFKDFPSSELPYAKRVSEMFQTNHYELVLEPEGFADHLERLTWMRDSPLSERSDVPMHLLAAAARRDVKVLLSGEGSDELFAGYPKYTYDRYASMISRVPKAWMQWIIRSLPACARRIEIALRSLNEPDDAARWAQWFSPFTQEEKRRLLPKAQSGLPNPTEAYVHKGTEVSCLDRMLYADCKLWLPENLLERYDRMTMAASVEGREPFLHHELVELAFRMPGHVKIRGRQRKWLVKQIAKKYLPQGIFGRRKNGFEVPLADWFRGKLRDMCYDRICARNRLVGEVFSRQEVQAVLDEHCSGRKDNFLKIWTLLGLAIWAELFLGPSQAKAKG